MRYARPVLVRPRRSANLRSEAVDFLNDKLLHAFDRVLLFKEKVEFLTINHTLRLVFWGGPTGGVS
jgi:hypothetical protein